MAKHCLRCKKLREQLRVAIQQKLNALKLAAERVERQRRAETLLVGYKSVVLEAMRR